MDTIKINIGDLKVLVSLKEEFLLFNERVGKYFENDNKDKLIRQLDILLNNKRGVVSNKTKVFYSNNKSYLDLINSTVGISRFFNRNYNNLNEDIYSTSLYKVFSHICDGLDDGTYDINKLELLVNKLSDLDIDTIIINDSILDANLEHRVLRELHSNVSFNYVDKPDYCPSYHDNLIKYKTGNSNYILNVGCYLGKILKTSRIITIRDLSLDHSLLPEKIDVDHIFKPLIEQSNIKNKENKELKHLFEIDDYIKNIESNLSGFFETVNEMNDDISKEKYLESLKEIQFNLGILVQLKFISELDLFEKYDDINDEIFFKEKKEYESRKIKRK